MKMTRISKDEKMYFYDRFAESFDKKMNMYDTNRRLEIIFDEILTEDIRGKELLDAGSGTGWFSKRAVERGARVTSLDVGENILAQVARKCNTRRVVGSVCEMEFRDSSFDFVVSTEVIEHTPDPRKAVREMHRVLKKDGVLVLTVPNKVWHFSISLANFLRLRPYEGYENWVGWSELRKWLEESGFEILEYRGFHIVPFVLPFTYGALRRIDRFGGSLGSLMLNIAVKARKR